jgi:hypothetical protein
MKNEETIPNNAQGKRGPYSDAYIKEAHRSTFANEGETGESSACRCFYCGHRFSVKEEEHLLYSEERAPLDRTLHCPYCLVDCVIGSASGYPIDDEEFIMACTEAWFDGISEISAGNPQRPTLIIVD